MPAKVPISEIGSAMAGISVARKLRRKRKITMITSTPASPSVNWTSSMAWRIECERSFSTLMSTPGGSWAWIAGSIALTRSTTSTVLASGWR